jgi:hypothetical protein
VAPSQPSLSVVMPFLRRNFALIISVLMVIAFLLDDFMMYLNRYAVFAANIIIFMYLALFVIAFRAILKAVWSDAAIYLAPIVLSIGMGATGVTNFIQTTGFYMAVYPVSEYLKSCIIVDFNENGRTYRLGACQDINRVGFGNSIQIFYDTSGEIALSREKRSTSWIVAMRKLYDQSESGQLRMIRYINPFERLRFYVHKVVDGFYSVQFLYLDDDGVGASGI